MSPQATPFKGTSEPATQGDPGTVKPESQPAAIKSITLIPGKATTRICIVSDGPVRYAKGVLDNPDRVYFDIKNARLDSNLLNKIIPYDDLYIKQARAGQNQLDLVRIVFDLKGAGEVTAKDLGDAFGITIDFSLKGSGASQPAAPSPPLVPSPKVPEKSPTAPPVASSESKMPNSTPAKPKQDPPLQPQSHAPIPAPRSAAETKQAAVEKTWKEEPPPALPAVKILPGPPGFTPGKEVSKPTLPMTTAKLELPAFLPRTAQPTSHGDRTLTRILGLKIGRIVLDPGHGGQDRGTVGPGGLMEKELVLALAKDLQRLLEEKLGAQVVLTRNDDSFVSLEDRTLIANQHQADLFVSIHANSSVIRSVSGVETYFLDFARTDSAREVAARENATSDRNIRDLQELVQKIAQADKLQESRELATIMQKYLYGAVRKLIPATSNRGVRSAPFIVLIGAHMPSVLAEISFISNPHDEKLFLKDANRQLMAAALFQGIEGYMKSLGSTSAKKP